MRVSLELFLLDNLVMDLLILRLGCIFSGARFRLMRALPFAAFGAVYAALSIGALPFLTRLVPKLLLGAAMALPLCFGGRSFLRGVVSLYLSAFLTGGTMFALTMLFGGTLEGGALIGTTPVRTVLLSAVVLLLLPRCIRELIALCRARERYVQLRIRMHDRALIVKALVDSGSLLQEPVSGKPVVLVQPNLLPSGGRPVPFQTIQGGGVVFAQDALRIEAHFGAWTEIDAMVAESPERIEGADAILPCELMEEKRRGIHVRNDAQAADAVVHSPADAKEKNDLLHLFRRNASRTVSARGGADVDREAEGRGGCGEERADRA